MKKATPKTELTRAELEVMQVIWRLGQAYLGEVVEQFAEPRPAYTTISTVIHTLERKHFLKHTVNGKSYLYTPTITKEEYREKFLNRVMHNFFNNSPSQLLSFFTEKDNLTVEQYEELKEIARQILENQKGE